MLSRDRSAGVDPGQPRERLSAEDRETSLRFARQTLESYLGEGVLPRCETDSPALTRRASTFVTLRRRDSGELRGCRGEIPARRPLIESVAMMAIAAAVDDTRFPPVTIEEVPEIHIEISALTPLAPIDPEEVVVGRHGLMIVVGLHTGLLLPQVPERFRWGREEFLEGVCKKAGVPADAWMSGNAKLYGFETEVWEEAE